MSNRDIKPTARRSNVVVQDYETEILIYDLTENKAFSLNEPSALIWQLCDGNKTVSEIAEKLSAQFNSIVSEDFVRLGLAQLRKDNLLENTDEVLIGSGVSSRREAIRSIGLATMIALPLVSSLIAPVAINASSTCSTAPPGGLQCRCDCSTVPQNSTCGTGLSVDSCNPGCTCTRTAAACYGGLDPNLIGTAQGSCS